MKHTKDIELPASFVVTVAHAGTKILQTPPPDSDMFVQAPILKPMAPVGSQRAGFIALLADELHEEMVMPTYLVDDVIVKDPKAYEQYREEIGVVIARHHGEYVVRGGEIEVVSGDWRPNRLIIVRFPDKASVRAYLNDPVFHRLSELRQSAITSRIVMVEGVET